jgi:hypothetical protein
MRAKVDFRAFLDGNGATLGALTWRVLIGASVIVFIMLCVSLFSTPVVSQAAHSPFCCKWRGTSPICAGECEPWEVQVNRRACTFGKKVKCCKRVILSSCRTFVWRGPGTPGCSKCGNAEALVSRSLSSRSSNTWTLKCCAAR